MQKVSSSSCRYKPCPQSPARSCERLPATDASTTPCLHIEIQLSSLCPCLLPPARLIHATTAPSSPLFPLTWQKGHQGAYSTSMVSLSLLLLLANASACCLLNVSTAELPASHKSRSALRSSVVPSAFLMLPECRPHSLAAGRESQL